MERADSATLKVGDDYSKASARFEAYLDGHCIHGTCRLPCVIWDKEKTRCSLKHQVRLMHRAPKGSGDFPDPAEWNEYSRILSLLAKVGCGAGVEGVGRQSAGVAVHVPVRAA
jgi:hypothetical protein